jgi:hypothetical protein
MKVRGSRLTINLYTFSCNVTRHANHDPTRVLTSRQCSPQCIINKYYCIYRNSCIFSLNMSFATLFSRPNSRASFLLVVHLARTYSVPAGQQAPKKVWDSVDAAVGVVKSGDVLLSGGTP